MKIAVITPDMSNNATMRAYWLADLLSHDHEVHIIGPQFGDGIYPVVPDDIPLEPTAASPIVPRFLPVMSELVDDISADLVIAVKPRVSSYGTALWHRRRHGTPLMLDIDDWEIGFRLDGGYLKAAVLALPSLAHVNGIGWLAMFERLVRYADGVIVSNPWLRDRFGGEEVVHPRDTDMWNPERFTQDEARSRLDLPADDNIVMFLGKPLAQKGTGDLVDAALIGDPPAWSLHLVGGSTEQFGPSDRIRGASHITVHGLQPYDRAPLWIAAADVMVVPQRAMPSARGQLPAKIFDAMSMGKPLVTTEVGPIPSIVGDAAEIIPPADPFRLRQAIDDLVASPMTREALGRRGKSRFERKYAPERLRETLEAAVQSAVSRTDAR